MRISLTMLVIGLGVFALSVNAQPENKPIAPPKAEKFLEYIKVGEKIVTRGYPNRQGISITVITTDEEFTKLVRSEEENRLYGEINKILRETGRTGLEDVDKLSEELQAVHKRHGSFTKFLSIVQSKVSSADTITRVGEDFFAYNHNGYEVFVPLHQIHSIKRPATNQPEAQARRHDKPARSASEAAR